MLNPNPHDYPLSAFWKGSYQKIHFFCNAGYCSWEMKCLSCCLARKWSFWKAALVLRLAYVYCNGPCVTHPQTHDFQIVCLHPGASVCGECMEMPQAKQLKNNISWLFFSRQVKVMQKHNSTSIPQTAWKISFALTGNKEQNFTLLTFSWEVLIELNINTIWYTQSLRGSNCRWVCEPSFYRGQMSIALLPFQSQIQNLLITYIKTYTGWI